jgi:hypothetical protein
MSLGIFDLLLNSLVLLMPRSRRSMVSVQSSPLSCERGLYESVVTSNGRPTYLRKVMDSLALSGIEAILGAELVDIDGRDE